MSLLECCVEIDRGKIDASRVGNSKCTIRSNVVDTQVCWNAVLRETEGR